MKLDDIATNKSNKVLGLDVPAQSDDSVAGRTGFTEQGLASYEQSDRLVGGTSNQWTDASDFDPELG